ncbi:MAG TPA: hypothetical protein VEZ70_02780 [Allosphingosinicella sp.]|nr:hypothetical protein [Allosphingosinicella sp.]
MAPRSDTTTIGWKVDREQRKELLQQFPPQYSNPVADHVTLRSRVPRTDALPGPVHGEIVGKVDDGRGVEAMVVRIDGTTDRPDGSTYHITWSLGAGRRAVESNDALRSEPWTMFDLPMPVKLAPARFR